MVRVVARNNCRIGTRAGCGQVVRQRTFNARIEGSIPSTRTIVSYQEADASSRQTFFGDIAQLVEHRCEVSGAMVRFLLSPLFIDL